jgi:hypothetical protein
MQDRVEELAVLIRSDSVRGVPRSRLALLFALFFLICLGLGYSILNRIAWRDAPGGLEDLQTYANLVVAPPVPDLDNHMQYRVLVPYLARPFYRLAKDHIGSWDPIMFGLLVVNSFFVSATVMFLLLVINHEIGSYNVALGSALIYLLNFAVPNLRLVGFIDAGEGFFLMLLVWVLLKEHSWTLPILGIVGATAKESFVPYMMVFTLTWWLCSRHAMRRPIAALAWIVAAWFAALTSMTALQWSITHVYRSPLRFGLELHNNTAYVSHFLGSFADRNLWYIFIWLLPLSLFRLKRLPRSWRIATAVTSLTAFAMNTYYGGAPGTIGRSLFSVAGPLLSAAVAILLFTGSETGGDTTIRINPRNAT